MTAGWNRVTQWAQVSDDSQYSVACARVNGLYRFEAWYLSRKPAIALGTFDDAESAREACTKHRIEQLRISQQLGAA